MSLTSCFCTSWNKEIVRVLEFRHCNLTFIPQEIYDYEESLEELYLDSNNIKELPRSLFHCEFLKKLGISDNELCTIPVAVATLVHLEELDISKNGIVELPDNIKCCKNLSLVEISVNPLGRLPEGFTHLINLTQLYLNDTLLDFLPANFGRLTKLKVLELRENHLQSLPKSICRLTELERLDLGQNDFKELPAVVGTLVNLKELWIDSNRIVQLPQSIGNLEDLIYFDASCNRIEYLPDEMEGLRSVADLHLSRNYLQELPKNIGKLSKLTTLKMDCNQLSSLPYSIGGLASLEELTLKANDLEEIPASIGLLRKLRYLNIDQNMLLSVPAELGSCSNITLLSLCGNYLDVLPDEIGRIRSLTVLNLSNNKLKYLPYSFTKLKKLQAMWLSDNQAKPMLQLQSDILETTGKRVLTCFMFPQHRRDPEDDFYISDGESFHASLWEEQRRERMQIAFDVSESENECNKSSIDRIPSPYPKEGVKLRPHVGNDNVHEPWHSSPIPSRRKSRDRTSYPKEGIKQRHRKSHEEEDLPDGRPHLARKMNGQAINALPNYPNVDTVSSGVRGRRDARMKEAKISRPRVSTSPIHDSLQLFRADKEKMAKDKLRIRHSSPEKSESEGDNKRSDSEMYSPKRTRVLGRREIKAKHDRGAMSDSETTRSNQSPLPVTLRRELLEAQSDVEHGRHTSDTQSDVGFRLHRRNWNDGPHETQSDVEFRVRGRRERLRNREYKENEKNQRLSDPNQFAQFNRNANATGAKQSPVGQRIPRKSGYSTDPGEGRPRQRVPPFRTPESKTKDDGYVHPSDYYKLPEYSVGDRQARTLDLKQLKSRGQTHVKGQPEIQGSPQNSHEKRTDIKNSTQYQPSPNLGRTQGQRGITPLQKGAPRIPNIQPSPDLGRTPGPPRIPNNQDNRGAMPTQQYHGSPRFGHRPGPVRPAQEDMHPPEGHGVAHRNEHVQRHHNVHTSKDYVDMSQSSPMSQRNASPSKNQIPSYEEALSRRREITPPRGRSPIEQGSPSVPVKEWHRQHNDYEPMRTTNQSFARPNISSQSATKPPVNHAVNNHTPVRQFNSAHQNSPQLRNQGNRLSNGKTRSLERHMEPLGGLGSLQDDDTRIQDVERDSGNSSNVTWSGSEALHSGYQEGRSNSGITTRREMHPDVAINDTDSALTESPSPTYSSSGLTPSPQQPHFPQSVRIPSPASADTKVPLATSTAVVAPTIRGSPLRGPPPPYHRRWGGGTEGMARDSLGYASEGEQKLGEPGSPSSFLVDQRPPSPNSTVLAWDTSAARRTLPSNNNSTQPHQEGDTRNGAKMMQLVIYKNPGLGFSITGGWNSQGNPYKPNDTGIFVTKIAPSGPADGTLQPGDKILEVNGQDFRNVTHDDAVQLLRKSNPVSLVVKRDS